CPVIIDETYYEFSGCTLADQLDRYRNLIIVRSFSKAFSVAGLRFGYIISHPDNIKELNKVMTIFHLNLLTQSFICAILDNKEVFLEHNHRVISLRNKLFDDLSCIEGIQVHPSHTNFLIFSLGKKTGEYYEFMIQNEVSLRPVWSHPLLHDYLRVSISSESANNIFLEKTREYARQNEWTIVDQ
ncbi:MAG: aminotransferase class I/II-fold pyridoxal phosphate-dependent enzyme, partial [Candidatus Cloacimonetes bacterium]|nr:aminotransferase class I/II-fold pyridoxal phosphate-dependent enzyme [Candidatus Cloacimonadota bacterium]